MKHLRNRSTIRLDKAQFFKKYLVNDYVQRRDPDLPR